MARVKICSVCEAQNGVRQPFCTQCGTSLADVTVQDTSRVAEAPIQSRTTLEGASSSGEQAVIEFAWGTAEVRSRLGIGRDAEFSTIALKLGEFVSRRHAEIFFEGDDLFVRHLGQTNPTYLNDRKLQNGEKAKLNDGDVVGFSTQERATVKIRSRQ